MARTPCIPPELTKGPFTLAEARAAGLTLSALTSKAWRRLGAELYCFAQLKEDPWQLLSGWQRSLPAEVVFAGGTAAWLLGLDVEPIDPVEIVVPPDSGTRPRVSPMRPVLVATPRRRRAAMGPADCVRWPRLLHPPNRRWKRGSVGF